MEQKVNALEICMREVTTTLKFLQAKQDDIIANQKEYSVKQEEFRKEVMDKIEAYTDHLDNKYAGRWVEDEICAIKKTSEQRNYDWLKYAVTMAISFLIGILTMILKNNN